MDVFVNAIMQLVTSQKVERISLNNMCVVGICILLKCPLKTEGFTKAKIMDSFEYFTYSAERIFS